MLNIQKHIDAIREYGLDSIAVISIDGKEIIKECHAGDFCSHCLFRKKEHSCYYYELEWLIKEAE